MTFGKRMAFPGAKFAISAGMVLGLTSGSLGCDTVALISFQERAFTRVEAIGMTPLAGSCDGSTAKAEIRFVMIADDATAIRPNDIISNQLVNLTRDSVEITDSRLYELPDVECDTSSCVYPGDGFTCGIGTTTDDAKLRRCNRDLTVSVGDVSFASDTDRPQLFAMIVENSGSLDGWLPSDVGAYYVDWDGDGFAEGFPDVNLVVARATDRSKNRVVAFNQVANTWRDAARMAVNENRRTLFGMWQFSGSSTADVRSLVALTPSGQVWTDQAATAISAVNQLETAGQRRANVYQAMSTVLEEAMADSEYANYDKTVVVFVDGPDDLRLNAFNEARVIAAAKAVNARLFIVHVDPSVATQGIEGLPFFRDDPRYIEDQDPCSSEESCENFEECRRPLSYASTPNAPVEISTNETYCLPKRDDNGRIGPIHAYQRIACETDGSYIYVTSATALRNRMQWLPHTMDGLWKVETTLDAFENRRVAAGEGFKVQGALRVGLGTRNLSFIMSQTGDERAGTQFADQDTRGVLFHK